MKNCFLLFLILCSCNSKNSAELSSNSITLEEQLIVSFCPIEMAYVSGQYCTQVLQVCKSYMESPDSTPFARCLEFNKTKCIGKTVELNFCIDKEEYTSPDNDIPLSDVSWTTAKNLCEQENKRLCKEPEWNFACEGEEMYPYTTGYTRPSKECNMDISKGIICNNKLCDLKESIDSNLECMSPFGVHNMAGNVDEWIEVPKYYDSKILNLSMRSVLKGGHWLPVRNRCRTATFGHFEDFHQVSVGFRCCSDI